MSKFTQRQVADAMEWSLSKLIRIESDEVRLSMTDLRALLQHYGIADPDDIRRYLEMARASKEPPRWWAAYKDVASPEFLRFIGFENTASAIQGFQPMVIHGLLQNEQYAQAVIQATIPSASRQEISRRVALRMQRQEEIFERSDAPDLLFVLDETILHRRVGGVEVMRSQLQRMRRDAERDNVTIEVVPFSAGAHAGMRGPFTILELPTYGDDVLYLETAHGILVSRDDQEEIEHFRRAMAEIRLAVGDLDHIALLDDAIERLQ